MAAGGFPFGFTEANDEHDLKTRCFAAWLGSNMSCGKRRVVTFAVPTSSHPHGVSKSGGVPLIDSKPGIVDQVLADLISDQIEKRQATELRAVLSTGNEITMHGKFTIGRDFIIYRTAKDDNGRWAMTPFSHIVQLIV
nr:MULTISPECIES: hypothetical protein [Sinorhizobium/Ensifer group]